MYEYMKIKSNKLVKFLKKKIGVILLFIDLILIKFK